MKNTETLIENLQMWRIIFWSVVAIMTIGSLCLYYFDEKIGNLKTQIASNQEKEDAFKKVIDCIVFGENSDANTNYFNSFLLPELNDDQLEYIYNQVSLHPIRFNTYDFLLMFVTKKSKFADAFYIDLLLKSNDLKDIERSLVYNCFQKHDASAYENVLSVYILKTSDPTNEFIKWCEFLTQTDNVNKLSFLVNLFNDNQLINKLNKSKLMEKCKEWDQTKNKNEKSSRFERLVPNWQGTYFESEIVNQSNAKKQQ